MIYFTYILQSQKDCRFYIGQTQNLNNRLTQHNSGKSKYTSKFTPWNLVWFIELNSRKEAFILNQNLKNGNLPVTNT